MKLEDAIKIWKVCEGRTFIQINCSAKEREALRTVIEKAEKWLELDKEYPLTTKLENEPTTKKNKS